MAHNNNFWCEHKQTRLVYKRFSNGTINYYRQCVFCFAQATDYIKKKSLGNEILSAVDENESGNGLVYPQTQQQAKEHRAQVRRHGLDRYDQNYLNTDAWQKKRAAVLKRDRGICQSQLRGCTHKATEVHHLTYANVPNEPLIDLISVCGNCHDRIEKDKKIQWVQM